MGSRNNGNSCSLGKPHRRSHAKPDIYETLNIMGSNQHQQVGCFRCTQEPSRVLVWDCRTWRLILNVLRCLLLLRKAFFAQRFFRASFHLGRHAKTLQCEMLLGSGIISWLIFQTWNAGCYKNRWLGVWNDCGSKSSTPTCAQFLAPGSPCQHTAYPKKQYMSRCFLAN